MAPVQRVLIHTWVSDLPDDEWPTDFPYPTVALIDWLADQGAVLLGMDAPSVDDFNSQDLPGHHRLRQRDMVHLELITLAGVPDGVYELIALPLKIAEACGSPVRAILRELP
jgi:arylformamidase